MHIVKWEDILWLSMSIPATKLGAIRQVANQLRLRLSDGVPTMLGSSLPSPHMAYGMSAQYFPGSILPDGRNNTAMLTVESLPTNPLHNSEFRLNGELVQRRESKVIDALEHGKKPKPLDIYHYIYGFESKPSWLQD